MCPCIIWCAFVVYLLYHPLIQCACVCVCLYLSIYLYIYISICSISISISIYSLCISKTRKKKSWLDWCLGTTRWLMGLLKNFANSLKLSKLWIEIFFFLDQKSNRSFILIKKIKKDQTSFHSYKLRSRQGTLPGAILYSWTIEESYIKWSKLKQTLSRFKEAHNLQQKIPTALLLF